MVTLHKATVDEVLEIKKLLYETWVATYKSIHPIEHINQVTSEWHAPEFLASQIKDHHAHFEVAKDEEKIVGMCNASLVHDGLVLNIQRLHVSPDYQRQGVGSLLIHSLLGAFPHITTIELEVDKHNYLAMDFYKKHGFTKKGEKIFVVQNVTMECIVMEKMRK